MKTIISKWKYSALLLGLCVLSLTALGACTNNNNNSCPETEIVYLRAEAKNITMPDGRVVTMWGYAKDSSFEALDGNVKVPGPEISLKSCTTKLVIVLDNNLPEPTSIVINGQASQMAPVRNPDGRVRSFVKETASGNTTPVEYVFDNLREGTYLYETGTHPAVQVQMGLYGAMTREHGNNVAYPQVPYDNSTTIVYSDVDPDIHDAVASGNYGPGKSTTSTIEFHPKYLLLSGTPLSVDGVTIKAKPGNNLLFRFVNAGISSHAPVLNGAYMTAVAEDGNQYAYPKQLYSLFLPAGKTEDALVTVPSNGKISLIVDRLITHM